MVRPATELPTREFSPADVVPDGATRRFDPSAMLGHIGGYDLVHRLGRGVFVGQHSATRQELAVRVLDAVLPGRLDLLERQLAEVSALASIDHPNVVRAIEIGTDAGRVFMAMEYLRGTLLEAVLEMYGPPVPAQAIRIGTLVARGLAAAHAAGVVHRALETSAAMVMRSESGRCTIKLIDFAIAEGTEAVRVARPSMAPELVRGEAVDRRADIYSFGVLLHRVCTGRDPFAGSPIELLAMHRFRSVVRPELALAGVPGGLAAVIRRCLAEEPSGRYQSAEEVIEALRAAAYEIGQGEPAAGARPAFTAEQPRPEMPAAAQAAPQVPTLMMRPPPKVMEPMAVAPTLMAPQGLVPEPPVTYPKGSAPRQIVGLVGLGDESGVLVMPGGRRPQVSTAGPLAAAPGPVRRKVPWGPIAVLSLATIIGAALALSTLDSGTREAAPPAAAASPAAASAGAAGAASAAGAAAPAASTPMPAPAAAAPAAAQAPATAPTAAPTVDVVAAPEARPTEPRPAASRASGASHDEPRKTKRRERKAKRREHVDRSQQIDL